MCEQCLMLREVLAEAEGKIQDLHDQLAGKEALINRLHNQLTMCEAARQRQESRNPLVRLREAWRSISR